MRQKSSDKGRKLLRTILVINKLFRKNKIGGDVSRLLSGILLKKSASAVARPELVKTIIDSFGEIKLRSNFWYKSYFECKSRLQCKTLHKE